MGAGEWKKRRQALAELAECAAWIERRDELVRNAASAGCSKTVIAGMIGLDRSTIYEILGRQREQVTSE